MSPANCIIRVRQAKHAVYFMFFLLNTGLFLSCENLDIERKVMLKTGDALVVASKSAIVSGTVFDVGESGLIQYGHCWSDEHNPTVNFDPNTGLGSNSTGGVYNSLLTGLSPDTRYFVRSYVSDNSRTIYGDVIELKTVSQNTDIFMPTTSEAFATYAKNPVVIDGKSSEPEWNAARLYTCTGKSQAMLVSEFMPSDLSCSYKVLFNEEGIMFWISVNDANIVTYEDVRSEGVLAWMADYAEIYLHYGDYPTPDGAYTVDNSFQIRFNPYYSSGSLPSDLDTIVLGRYGRDWKPLQEMYSFVDFIVVPSDKGYNVEALVQWELFARRPENLVYFEIQAGDADDPEVLRESIIAWNNTDNATRPYEEAWRNINFFGRLLLYNPNP